MYILNGYVFNLYVHININNTIYTTIIIRIKYLSLFDKPHGKYGIYKSWSVDDDNILNIGNAIISSWWKKNNKLPGINTI